MIKKYTKVIPLMIVIIASSMSFAFAQANYAWIAEFDGNYSNSRTFNDGATGSTIRSLTVQSTSNTDEYVIEWDNFNNKWQNGVSPYNTEFTLFWGTGGSPNGAVSSNTTSGNYYTFQIDGLSYSNRNAVIMETSNMPVNITTVSNSVVAPSEDEVITITLSAAKSPEERVFIRYSDNGFSTSDVVEVSFATATASTGTATILGNYNTPGKSVTYYAYSTTVGATSSSNHDLISLRLGNNGGANYSYIVENNWETINNGDFSLASTWKANSVPPTNQNLVITSNLAIDQDVNANSIICQTGNELTVNSGNILTIASGDITPLGITGSGSLTINGTLSISEGGYTDIVPNYNAGSTLEYINIVGSYNRFNEWTDNVVLGAGVPDNIVIDNTELDITNSAQATLVDFNINSNLTIQNNGILTVDATESLSMGGNLNNTGSIVLNSVADDYSSLIVSGTSTGNVTYNRYVNFIAASGGNDLISAPVSGQAFDVFIDNNTNIRADPNSDLVLFGGFDNDANSFELWNETDTTPLNAGVGYRSGIDTDPPTNPNQVQFEGTVNTSTVDITVKKGTNSKWNLIGNPYPSYISAQAFLNNATNQNTFSTDPNSGTDVSLATIYGYNNNTGSGGIYTPVNLATILNGGGLSFSTWTRLLLSTNFTSGTTIQFAPAMQEFNGGDDFIQGRTSNVVTSLKLELSNAIESFITDFYFTEFSSLGLDQGYDASLFGGSAPAFALYSHLVEDNNNVPLAIQALGELDYANTTVALGVNANQGEQITFNISTNTLPATVSVYLEDNVANTSTLLNSNDYVLTPATDLNGTGRFYLNFTDSALSIPQTIFDDLIIYTNLENKTIIINGALIEDTVANIYDIQGRLVNSKFLDSNEALNTIDVNTMQTGVYIVQLSNGNQLRTEKVIIN